MLLHGASGAPEESGCFHRELRNEGAWVVFDPDDQAHRFAAARGALLYRHTAATGWRQIAPGALTEDEKRQSRLPIVAIDPNQRVFPRPLFFGTTRIWKSSDDGESWRPVSVELDGSPVSAIHICRHNSRRIYVGTELGAVHRSDDGGNTWSENLGGVDLPYRYITRIATRDSDANHVLATIGPLPPPAESMNFNPYSHIYFSTDGGRRWRNADPSLMLPVAPHNCVVLDDLVPYVATDFGVYRGSWSEEKQDYVRWDDISGNLPKAFVMDLVLHGGSRTITAATFGRGLFRHKLGK